MSTDRTLFILISFCIFTGIVFSLSLPIFTTLYFDYSNLHFFTRQIIIGLISIYIIWALSQLDPDKYLKIIGLSIFFIFLILMSSMHYLPDSIVTESGGARRWIRLPGFSLSPVEFFKIGFVYFLAWSFTRKLNDNAKTLKEEIVILLPYIALFLLVIYLIAILQNDLGQVVVLALTLMFMAFFAGTSMRLFILSSIASIIVFVLVIITSSHRIIRVKTWWSNIQDMILSIFPSSIAKNLRVENAPQPYQISHSLNAIHHGGFFGQGIGNSFFKLGYLSEIHTDFVLSGMSEEIGFLGVLIITFIMLIIIYRIFKISSRSEKKEFHLFSLGIGLLIFFSFIMNAYGITSITPIKGIAVPFLSYRGSSLLALSFGMGMVLMISKRAKL